MLRFQRGTPDRATALGWALVVAAVVTLACPVAAQQPNGAERSDFQVLRVKYARATDLARVLSDLFKGASHSPVRVIADERTNSILVKASPNELAAIKEVLLKIDTDASLKSTDTKQIRIYPLSSPEKATAVEKLLKQLLPDLRVGQDPRQSQIVLAAEPEILGAAERLIREIDKTLERPKAEPAEVQVRAVWLVDGGRVRMDGQSVPEEFNGIATELKKHGFQDPRIAGEVSAYTQVNTRFEAQGTVPLFGSFGASGVFRPNPGKSSLEITIETKGVPGKRTESSFLAVSKLSVTITAPIGQLIVLGMTPGNLSPSAFVVQVLPKKQEKPVEKKP